MYEGKTTAGINLGYFMQHAEEIINDTEHLLTHIPYPMILQYLKKMKKSPWIKI